MGGGGGGGDELHKFSQCGGGSLLYAIGGENMEKMQFDPHPTIRHRRVGFYIITKLTKLQGDSKYMTYQVA